MDGGGGGGGAGGRLQLLLIGALKNEGVRPKVQPGKGLKLVVSRSTQMCTVITAQEMFCSDALQSVSLGRRLISSLDISLFF